MANILECGKDMKVWMIGAMPRESFTDIAAAVTRSEKDMEDIISMDYDESLVKVIVGRGHLAATEFDYFIFAVEGVGRPTEIQLVRKRLASYLIKSGRTNKKGKRSFDVVRPSSLNDFYAPVKIPVEKILVNDMDNLGTLIGFDAKLEIDLGFDDLVEMTEQYYNCGVKQGLPEEDLRYAKQQGTEWKGLIAMNGHALLDWFKIRCCANAQFEIRTLANKMLVLCKEHSPALFEKAGASCKVLGYCPENGGQNTNCRGAVMTHTEVLMLIYNHMHPFVGDEKK